MRERDRERERGRFGNGLQRSRTGSCNQNGRRDDAKKASIVYHDMKEYETQEKIIYNYAFCYVLLIIAEAGRLFFYSINNKKGEGRILFIIIFLCDFFLTIFPCHAFFSLRNWIYPLVIETLYRAFLLTCLTMTTVYSFKVKFST